MSKRWEVLDGRNLAYDGKRVVYIGIVPDVAKRYAIEPHYADVLAHTIAQLLNAHNARVAAAGIFCSSTCNNIAPIEQTTQPNYPEPVLQSGRHNRGWPK